MKSRKPLIVLIGLAVVAAAGIWFYHTSTASVTVSDKDLVTVPRIDYPQVILCPGFLEAKSSVQVTAPVVTDTSGGGGGGRGGGGGGGTAPAGGGGQGGVGNQFKLIRMVDEGTQVSEGDFLVEFDGTNFATQLRNQQANYQSYQERSQRQRSTMESNRRQNQLDLDEAKANLGILEQKINAQAEIESAITIAITKIQRDMAQTQVDMLEKQIKYQDERDRIDMQIQRSNENKTNTMLGLLLDTMDSLTIRAPVSGIVIYKRDQLNQLPQLGSNWSPTNWILQIPDLSTMRVKVNVDEMDVGKVRVGQKARVTVPALQGLALDAKVIDMSPILTLASFDRAQKVATARVELDPGQDMSLLRPGMSVNVQIQVGVISKTLAIPMSCIQERNGGSYVQVYQPDKKNFEWREIDLLTNDEEMAVIKSGLAEKERIRSKPKV